MRIGSQLVVPTSTRKTREIAPTQAKSRTRKDVKREIVKRKNSNIA
jgi:hypothetical protein